MPTMNVPRQVLLAATLLTLALLPIRSDAFGWPNQNDSIFPPMAAAKPYINFDGRGFLIHGRRTFIAAGELQYSRTPRAMWRDRMLRIKRAGYNSLQTYCFWNYHEPTEGKFDFKGDKDFDAYLKLAHSLGLYVVVRMGPYVNSEWDSGGLPLWLRFKPGLLPMQDNAPFYQAVTPYFNRLVPIIAANQINHGGSVILVQMENENKVGGGTDLPTPYYRWFHNKMLAMNLQVPIFFSGLNHGDDPAGDSPFDTSKRTSPWYSTEFWTGWFGLYGSPPDRAQRLERATWKVIAYGGSGYSHYTFAGGTNFNAWNSNEQGASYDFCGPIGQTGDLRDVYYREKRAATFATSFPEVIENSLASSGGQGVTTTNPQVQITNRKGPAGQILFLDNPGNDPVTTQIRSVDGKSVYPSTGPITLAPREILPIVNGYPLVPGVNLRLAATRILGLARQGLITTLIVYGVPGESVEVHFDAKNAIVLQQPTSGKQELSVSAKHDSITLLTKFPAMAPTSSVFRVGSRRIRILTMSLDMADRTWFLQGGSVIACGPDYIGEVTDLGGILRLATEQRGLVPNPHPLPLLVYGLDSAQSLVKHPQSIRTIAPAAAPTLGKWLIAANAPTPPEVQPGLNDIHWKTSAEPMAMGADGDNSAFAWYRTKVTVPDSRSYQLNLSSSGDWVTCFVNGTRVVSSDANPQPQSTAPRHLLVPLQKGTNSLAFLTAHYGRLKLYDYYGPMDTIDAKGISGAVTLDVPASTSDDTMKFRWQADDAAPGDAAKFAAPELNTTGADWHDADVAADVFNGRVGWVWYRTTLKPGPGPHRRLHFNSIDDNGVVFLNGKQIAGSVGINAQADVSLDSAWNEKGPNVLAVAVQNLAGSGNIGYVRFDSGIPDGQVISGWKMRGGVVLPAAWKANSFPKGLGVPGFYRTTFTAMPPGESGPHPILRASLLGMSRGTVWLNGHNLGRYPEKSPVDGLYLPETWLLTGKNTLEVFDEEGNAPDQIKIVVEVQASRLGAILVPGKAPRVTNKGGLRG